MEKKEECPICMEMKSTYNSIYCSNNHMSCCSECRKGIILSTTDDRCPVCRKNNIITLDANDINTLQTKNQRLQTQLDELRDENSLLNAQLQLSFNVILNSNAIEVLADTSLSGISNDLYVETNTYLLETPNHIYNDAPLLDCQANNIPKHFTIYRTDRSYYIETQSLINHTCVDSGEIVSRPFSARITIARWNKFNQDRRPITFYRRNQNTNYRREKVILSLP